MSSMAKSDWMQQWLDEARKDLSLKNKPYVAPPCIFSTSKALLKEYADGYVPQIVSIGPFHLGREQLGGMETYKGDAARREVLRIQIGTDNYEFTFEKVIEKIREREEEIKRCYDKGTPAFHGKVFLWMVTRDAYFILEFFRNHLSGLPEVDDDAEELFKNDFGIFSRYHPIFGPECENPGVKSEIRKDLIKLDNQIPLFILEDFLSMETMDLDSAKAKLNKLLRCMFQKFYYRPFEFCAKGESPKRSHILDIYHYSCLGVVGARGNEIELNPNLCCTCFARSIGVQCSCFGRGPQQYCANHAEQERGRSPTTSAEIGRDVRDAKQRNEWWLKVPSAVELKNGVKFQTDCKTVDDIKFEGKTLTLVPLKLDVDSEVYIRNLIAVEICSPHYKHKRMTAYAKFMHELCQTGGGVDVMRERHVIIGNLWYSKRVTRLLSVSNLTISQPAGKSVKEARERLNECYKTRRSIILTSLWNEFWKAHGSKPWLVVGGIGATIVLFLTAIQVFCLFKSCGASSK